MSNNASRVALPEIFWVLPVAFAVLMIVLAVRRVTCKAVFTSLAARFTGPVTC